MRKNTVLIIALTCVVISIVLMLLPISAVLVFAPNPAKRLIKTFSYFDMIVLGYGNVFPLLTAVLSIVLLIILLWTILSQSHSRKRERSLTICSIICVITSVLSLLLFGGISIAGIAIFILLLLSTILEFRLFYRSIK